jgi:hypothetical protein
MGYAPSGKALSNSPKYPHTTKQPYSGMKFGSGSGHQHITLCL